MITHPEIEEERKLGKMNQRPVTLLAKSGDAMPAKLPSDDYVSVGPSLMRTRDSASTVESQVATGRLHLLAPWS
jgi:hypothetical protein